jgi:hypothetical protein
MSILNKRVRESDNNTCRDVAPKLLDNALQNSQDNNTEAGVRNRGIMQQAAVANILAAGNDFYKILRVKKDATRDKIKEHYKLLLKLVHPDYCSIINADRANLKLNEAYKHLNTLEEVNDTRSHSSNSKGDDISGSSYIPSDEDESLRTEAEGEIDGETLNDEDNGNEDDTTNATSLSALQPLSLVPPVTDKDRDDQLGFAPEIAESLGNIWRDKFCFDKKWFSLSDGKHILETVVELKVYEHLKRNSNISPRSEKDVSIKNKILKLAKSTLPYLKAQLPRLASAKLDTEDDKFITWFDTNFERTADERDRILVDHLATEAKITKTVIWKGMELIGIRDEIPNKYYKNEHLLGTSFRGIYKCWKRKS